MKHNEQTLRIKTLLLVSKIFQRIQYFTDKKKKKFFPQHLCVFLINNTHTTIIIRYKIGEDILNT